MLKNTTIKNDLLKTGGFNINLVRERRMNSVGKMTEEEKREAEERWGKQYRRPKNNPVRILTEEEQKEIEARWERPYRRPRYAK